MLGDGQGVPLVAEVSAANVPDVNRLLPLVDAAADFVVARRQRPRPAARRADRLFADGAYSSQRYRAGLCARGLLPVIRRAKGERGLAKVHSPIERTISWLHQSRRLRTRYARHARRHQAFLSLACSLICFRRL